MTSTGPRGDDQTCHYFYLHGLASSPESSKARFLSTRLGERRVTLHCPDLNEPDFSTLTITRMIRQVEDAVRALPPAKVVLFGSSLGALVAVHLAERGARGDGPVIDRQVLLAPALDFGTSRTRLGDRGLSDWRDSGWLEMMHHAHGEVRRLGYGLFADATQYDAFGTVNTVPTLIVQGRRDEIVDATSVERFARSRPHVRLVLVDDGHQLKQSVDRLWAETQAFLGLDTHSR